MKRLQGLQYLRGLAASAVVVFHAAARMGWDFKIGEAGVDLFFLLSGFLMVAITDADSRAGPFVRDRVRRIVPPYWIATSVILAGGILRLFPHLDMAPWHVVASYLFLPARSASGPIWPLLVPGWTLNYEMMFYALFALTLLVPASRLARLGLLAAVLSGLVVVGAVAAPASAAGQFYTHPIMLEFVVGGALAFAWERGGAYWPRWIGWPTLVLALCAYAAAGTLQTDRYRLLIFAVPGLLLLASALGIEGRGPVRRWTLPALIGDASYAIYLWHVLAIPLALVVGRRLGLAPWPLFAFAVAAGMAAGLAGYWLIERPLLRRRAGARASARRATEPLAAG